MYLFLLNLFALRISHCIYFSNIGSLVETLKMYLSGNKVVKTFTSIPFFSNHTAMGLTKFSYTTRDVKRTSLYDP